jgi:hypothetical protein
MQKLESSAKFCSMDGACLDLNVLQKEGKNDKKEINFRVLPRFERGASRNVLSNPL